MLELFKTAHEIMVDEERQNFLSTKIATVSYSCIPCADAP
jgi:large subunit ribosomal protein L1